jgi:hypothetical protein
LIARIECSSHICVGKKVFAPSIAIGCFGNDIDSLAERVPAAIQSELVNQRSFSSLVLPKALATKHNLSILAADPLELDAPPPAGVSPGPDRRLHFNFTAPENTPVIAALPAIHTVPVSIVKIPRIRDWLDEAHNLLMLPQLFPRVCFDESHPCLL